MASLHVVLRNANGVSRDKLIINDNEIDVKFLAETHLTIKFKSLSSHNVKISPYASSSMMRVGYFPEIGSSRSS